MADDVWAGVGIWGDVSEVGGILSPADGFRWVGIVGVLRDEISGIAGVVRYWLCRWGGVLTRFRQLRCLGRSRVRKLGWWKQEAPKEWFSSEKAS